MASPKVQPSPGITIINAGNFEEHVMELLELIATADFIAVDMETSGLKEKLAADISKTTVEQVYQEIRMDASSFGSLQMGLTFAQWIDGRYLTSTFTILVDPLVACSTPEGQEIAKIIDRKASVSQRVVTRLLQNRARAAEHFKAGVPYLSQMEYAAVGDWATLLDHHACSSDIGPQNEDVAAHLRDKVLTWLEGPREEALRICEPRGGLIRQTTCAVVKNIVRDNFGYDSVYYMKKPDCIVLEVAQGASEITPGSLSEKKTKLEAARQSQAGLLRVVEALMQRTCLIETACAPESDAQRVVDRDGFGTSEDLTHGFEVIETLSAQLLANCPVIAGHNIISDLCFLESMFEKPLPYDTMGFKGQLAFEYYAVLDTSMLMAPVADLDQPQPTLTELFKSSMHEMSSLPVEPKIEVGDRSNSPHTRESLVGEYDAGINSYMVMMLLLNQAYKIREPAGKPDANQQRNRDEGSLGVASALSRLPKYTDSFWTPYLNRLRVGNAGVLTLDPVLHWRTTWRDPNLPRIHRTGAKTTVGPGGLELNQGPQGNGHSYSAFGWGGLDGEI